MSIYFLDTTTITLLRHGNPNIQRRINQHTGDTVAITSVNVDEYLSGWYTMLRRAKDNAGEASASKDLAGAMMLLARFPVMPITEASLNRTDQLVKAKINVGKMDLKIAALALELNATVVTNNIRDFSRVPGLKVEDWSA